MNELLLTLLSKKPELYAPSTDKFWDDEHISNGMLKAHLNPNLEAATRQLDFVQKSVDWISDISNPTARTKLLDLGCGPGIYDELFTEKGYEVTGIDLSPRSIDYAKASAARKKMNITYLCLNYLTMDYDQEFDVITLIYCDFDVLSWEERKILLYKVQKALKPNGLFIFDVFTPEQYDNHEEISNFSYSNGGYWSEEPYACLYSFYRYDYCNTFIDQYIVIEKEIIKCYNIWKHGFTTEELQMDLHNAGFDKAEFYGNVAGESDHGNTICAIAHK